MLPLCNSGDKSEAAAPLGTPFPIAGCFDRQTSPSKEMEHHMKRLLLAFITLAAATALTAPAFAGLKDAKNKAECEKAGGVWVEKDNKCGVKKE